ncbi:elongation factor P maturation arginine rhamnosyltransferase EarP [Zwartia sp.]|uniref:elongation factor P maturation arginine rhamnosyltransferase EarP n=1 Tax=Zwartia sp. TaxID=2978004 RepID=UPI002726CE16|nr:elongation factor P maturation arginine rhamnosyltransferase EarP [Zwartia sp.]MDO9024310.1 elongation factor P maturation arginine rhamnosyltransferase EarP [Zwartia sp.]
MHADIFCRVVDNFGDIGVTWRLARQLQKEHGWLLRLWVDDLKSFQRLEPRVSVAATQNIDGIEILHWPQSTDFTPAPIVIATFSCDLPEQYVENMRAQRTHPTAGPESLWINVEYLSAEDWVEGFHGLPSLRADGLSSYFFFPGFTEHTGGLLRESALIAQRDIWQTDRAAQRTFLEKLGLSQAAVAALFPVIGDHPAARLVNLFCYNNAPVAALIEVLRADPRKTVLLIPEGIHPQYTSGQQGQLFIERVPFLPQNEYDKVLWTADLNFVRGEDSIVRGIWAGKPLIWQIYPQTENTHLEKLRAWLAQTGLPEDICTVMLCWNPESAIIDSADAENSADSADPAHKIKPSGYKNISDDNDTQANRTKTAEFGSALQRQLKLENFHAWQQHAHRFCTRQRTHTDLATALTMFCMRKLSDQSKFTPERLK